MTSISEEVKFKAHPISLNSLFTKELSIRANDVPDIDKGIDGGECEILVGHSEYNKENKSIVVALVLKIEEKEGQPKPPFIMKIEIAGHFTVDEERFPSEHILHWAKNGAAFVLMPYLREQAYSLSSKGGFRPIILPLTEVPTITVAKPNN